MVIVSLKAAGGRATGVALYRVLCVVATYGHESLTPHT